MRRQAIPDMVKAQTAAAIARPAPGGRSSQGYSAAPAEAGRFGPDETVVQLGFGEKVVGNTANRLMDRFPTMTKYDIRDALVAARDATDKDYRNETFIISRATFELGTKVYGTPEAMAGEEPGRIEGSSLVTSRAILPKSVLNCIQTEFPDAGDSTLSQAFIDAAQTEAKEAYGPDMLARVEAAIREKAAAAQANAAKTRREKAEQAAREAEVAARIEARRKLHESRRADYRARFPGVFVRDVLGNQVYVDPNTNEYIYPEDIARFGKHREPVAQYERKYERYLVWINRMGDAEMLAAIKKFAAEHGPWGAGSLQIGQPFTPKVPLKYLPRPVDDDPF